MNIQNNMNKLLYALRMKGYFYKINSFKSYSEKNNKYCIKYQILKKQLIEKITKFIDEENAKIEYEEKYVADYECYSKIDIMKYLIKEYQEGSEADGR